MRRISLSLRLVLIVVGAMFLLQMITVIVQISRDDGLSLGGVRPAFAREVATLVRMFDRMPPLRERLALEFLNAGRIGIDIRQIAPEPEPGGPLLRWSARAIENRIAEEGIALQRIEVSNVRDVQLEQRRGFLARLFGRHLRITVELQDGRFLVIDPSADVDTYVYGNLVAFAGGILGFLVLVAAVVFVLRETRPLHALAANVEAFARTAIPTDLKEQGASDLRALIGATNRMQHQIAALIRNRALVLAGMSHDLRTQVTKLRLRLELLDPTPERDRAIADIEAMQALVEEALEFAAASTAVEAGRADVSAVLGRMVADRPEMTWPGHPPVHLAIGETALRRILENLVGNAIAYGQRADVTLTTDATHARIAIADRGPGIPATERELIFEPFYRLETSRSRSHGGSGLGLAIVRQILDRHQGSIVVSDREGGGAVFTVTLPLAE
jgi:two-component system osmolarity sensor histidine kinase EnvZ